MSDYAQSPRPEPLHLVPPELVSSPIAIPRRAGSPDLPVFMKDICFSATSSNYPQTPPLTSSLTMSASPASPQFQSPLLRTPCEIIHKVLCSSGVRDPVGLARAARTCKELGSLIYESTDTALWREIHLELYDDPRLSGTVSGGRDVVWKRSVQQREFVGRISREWSEERFGELPILLEPICSILQGLYLDIPPTAAPSNDTDSEMTDDSASSISSSASASSVDSLNIPLLEAILRSPIFAHLYYNHSYRATRPTLRPLSGQTASPLRRQTREDIHPVLSMLHCLLPPDFDGEDEHHRTHRGYLREMVYTASNYTEKNDWGPFNSDGEVDWRLLDALSSIMMANARDVIALGEDSWRLALQPLSFGLEAVRGWGWIDLRRPVDLEADDVWDWAGVEGTWCGSYAFLDYADWITLNEPRIVALRRQVGQLDLARYAEAVGDLLHMHLTIDRPCDKSKDLLPPVTSGIPTGDLLPPIHFSGSSAPTSAAWPSPAASSFVRGTVQLTADWPPQVRWTMVIRYGGEDRWKVEGVQMGGRGSKRGFFGVWTDATKELHSPNGPAWYWKT